MNQSLPPGYDRKRELALCAAVDSSMVDEDPAVVLARAGTYFAWLVAYPAARLTAQVTIKDAAGKVVMSDSISPANGENMADTMTDVQVVDISLAVDDAAGVALSDQLSWNFSDAGAILSFTVSPDTHSAHGVYAAQGNLGDVVVSVSDPQAPQLQPFTDTITVQASAATAIQGTVTVSDVPPPAGP